jgi:translation initiation factor IF-1
MARHKERRYAEIKPAVKMNGGYSRRQRTDILTAQGEITEALGYDNYHVELDNGVTILATISGKMRQNHIRVMVGDRVEMELSVYDLTKGRITRRFSVKQQQ